jgi:hypothetical protein
VFGLSACEGVDDSVGVGVESERRQISSCCSVLSDCLRGSPCCSARSFVCTVGELLLILRRVC